MNERIGGDYSLNAPRINHEESGEWLDALEDTNTVDQETVASEKQELEKNIIENQQKLADINFIGKSKNIIFELLFFGNSF